MSQANSDYFAPNIDFKPKEPFAPNIVYSITADFKPNEPGRRCIGSNKDGNWLVYVDSEPDTKPSCFLWNHILKAKVNLPCLPDEPNSFFKCVFGCWMFSSCGNRIKPDSCCYSIYLFYNNDPICISTSVYDDVWDKTQYALTSLRMCSDVVFVESISDDKDMPETACYISRVGLLYFAGTRIRINSPSGYYIHGAGRRLVVNYGVKKDRLFLLERKPQRAWEVWELDFLNQSFERVFDLEGIVVFLSPNYSAAYSHRPNSGLSGNCICFMEEGDDDNLYVFCLADQTLSIFENKPHSGFPVWFPTTCDLRMPSFVEEDVRKDAFVEEPKEKTDKIKTVYPDECNGFLSIYHELPEDLQELVVKSLCSADYANFRLTCRKWRDIARSICWRPSSTNPSIDKIPWLLSFQEKDSLSSIIDTTDNITYYQSSPELSGCRIRYSKYGWLLVTRGLYTIFFFEPFSKTKIDVVDMEDYGFPPDCMAFSSSPTLSNWTIIGIANSSTSLFISHLSSDDKEWDYEEYELEEAYLSGCNLICTGSSRFFYLYPDGSLGNIHFEDSKLKFGLLDDIDGSSFGLLSNYRKGYLVCGEDKLYVVVIEPLRKHGVNVYEFDVTAWKWKEVKTLGKYSFFISQTSSSAVPVTDKALESRINFPLFVENHHLSYKLDVSEFTCDDDDKRKELLSGIWLRPRVCRKYRR